MVARNKVQPTAVNGTGKLARDEMNGSDLFVQPFDGFTVASKTQIMPSLPQMALYLECSQLSAPSSQLPSTFALLLARVPSQPTFVSNPDSVDLILHFLWFQDGVEGAAVDADGTQGTQRRPAELPDVTPDSAFSFK